MNPENIGKWAATQRQIRRVWALSKPYFASEDRWRARALLGSVVALNLALVYMNVLFNEWNKVFYDALQEKNADVFWEQLARFAYLACAFIVIAVYKFYLTQLLQMRWRSWMTQQYLNRWMTDNAFYRFELARYASGTLSQGSPDNPDQRIQEDINHFTTLTIGLSMGLLNSLVTLASFVGILWTLSGSFGFSMGGADYVIPGFMVWMALVYCIAGSVITHYIGRSQIGLNFEQQRVEANFRHRMLRVREYSESIALDRGAPIEREQLGTRFSAVLGNYLALIRAQKRLVWFTSFFGQAAVVFPFLVAAPRFFSGAIHLGELMQISSAFGQVQGALSWIVDNYSSLANWRAITDRLTGFEHAFESVSQADPVGKPAPEVAATAQDLSVSLPDGTPLLTQTAFSVASGQSILIKGPSGSGKSTLLRTLAGIWPFAQGRVSCAPDAMFLPQRPYLPDGTLRSALAYPGEPESYTDAQLCEALQRAELPQLCEQLDQTNAWSQKLSGGEQQRLAFARVMLKSPRWVFADEATSALDEKTEALLYARLKEMVHSRDGSLVSVAHRPGVSAFHGSIWTMEPREQGSPAKFELRQNPNSP